MEYRTLGRSGLVVSTLGIGTMTFGVETSPEEAHEALDAFVAAGGTMIDTADVYGSGVAEQIIGDWLAARDRDLVDPLVISTKGRFRDGPDANAEGLSRRHLRRALEGSLRRLGRDHIDLYQLHAWDDVVPLEESLEFARDAIARGEIAYLGVSNFHGWQLQRAADLGELDGHVRVVSNQVQYNLMSRDVEAEVVPCAVHSHVGLVAWSPLAGGWLTGKYTSRERPDASTRMGQELPAWLTPMRRAATRGVDAFDRRAADARTWSLLEALEHVVRETGLNHATVSLSWLLTRPGVAAVVVGARNADQLLPSLGAADAAPLSAEQLSLLDGAWTPLRDDYLYGPIGQNTARRSISTTH